MLALYKKMTDAMPEPHFYELLLLGDRSALRSVLETKLMSHVAELGVPPHAVKILDEKNAAGRSRKLPSIAVFFGYEGAADTSHPLLRELLDDSVTIVTLVSALTKVSNELPECLRHINALSHTAPGAIDRTVSTILEHFRLLRSERKLFISYKRSDSQSVANALYDELDRRGFDVFIDTRSVPPAKDFQKELWHRLADSDIIVLLDTPGFRLSRWTTEELARANATNVQILHILWPGQEDDGSSAFSCFHRLTDADFSGSTLANEAALGAKALSDICDEAEGLRARAIAARYRYLVDGFCDAARDLGFSPNVHPDRWISVERKDGMLGVIPAVGVPTSDRIHRTFSQLASQSPSEMWLIYDNRGLLEEWVAHLDWLDKHLPIRTVRMATAYEALGGAG
jgi:hypothetical protein